MKVQITVDDELWKRTKAAAAIRGDNLSELVGVALVKFLKDIGVVVDFLPKPLLVERVVPVTDEEVPEKRCFKCKSKVREWTMTEKGPLCPDCKSQMEVSIP